MFGGVAYAANGGAFLLGRSNSETATATLKNTAGTPLSLVAKSGYAPLKVNSAVKVANLNADRLDGIDSTQFLRSTGVSANSAQLGGKPEAAFALATAKTGYVESATDVGIDVNSDGIFEFYTAEATCPAGTVLTGGGAYAGGSGDVFYTGPSQAGKTNTWQAYSMGTPTNAYAVCLNLRGAVPAGVNPMAVSRTAKVAPLAKIR
jgi:hypothetical protein